jgi:DNA-binding cell septation regulator SpoVG
LVKLLSLPNLSVQKEKSMKLLELHALPGDRKVRAFATVELDNGIVIRDFRIIQEPRRLPMVANPQVSWRDPADGQLKYKVLITLPKPLKNEVDLLVLEAWMGMKESRVDSSNQQPK